MNNQSKKSIEKGSKKLNIYQKDKDGSPFCYSDYWNRNIKDYVGKVFPPSAFHEGHNLSIDSLIMAIKTLEIRVQELEDKLSKLNA